VTYLRIKVLSSSETSLHGPAEVLLEEISSLVLEGSSESQDIHDSEFHGKTHSLGTT